MRTVLTENREFGGKNAPFKLREVKGARSITVRITHEGVVVTKPRWVGRKQVETFLKENNGWLEIQVAKWEEKVAETLSDQVLYLGQVYGIRKATSGPVRLAGSEFWATGATPQERLKNVMDWMQRRSRQTIRLTVATWAPKIKVAPKRVSIRDQVSRWGSCSVDGSLSFNWRLVMAPPEVLEYIVIHELAHIREHNHSKRFWSLVGRFCGDYEEYEKWLDDHNDRIMLTGRGK